MNESTKVATIMCHGHTAICPACSGLMRFDTPELLRCMDCKARFQYSGEGVADKEITIKKVG